MYAYDISITFSETPRTFHLNFLIYFYNNLDIWHIACLGNRLINYANSKLNELINRPIRHIFQKLKTTHILIKKDLVLQRVMLSLLL